MALSAAELDDMSFSELKAIVMQRGWDSSGGDGSIPLSGA